MGWAMTHKRPVLDGACAPGVESKLDEATPLYHVVGKPQHPAGMLEGSKSLSFDRLHQYQPLAIATVNARGVNDPQQSRSRDRGNGARLSTEPVLRMNLIHWAGVDMPWRGLMYAGNLTQGYLMRVRSVSDATE